MDSHPQDLDTLNHDGWGVLVDNTTKSPTEHVHSAGSNYLLDHAARNTRWPEPDPLPEFPPTDRPVSPPGSPSAARPALIPGNVEEPNDQPRMIRHLETRPISHDKLVVEINGIYAGLVLVEQKCKEVDEKQSLAALEGQPHACLSNEQWQALLALHKTLLHEHHDFFLASQHPSASPTLSRLARKYSMPARMWRHGIHAFLDVLQCRLPASSDHMLAFIYIAYSMLALLYETVPTFEETWMECLGDLARYRIAIEKHDIQDRKIWVSNARFWYRKGADNHPELGRLYHHLAILAKPNSLQQLSLYSKSLTSVEPFYATRESIMAIFQPLLSEGMEIVKAEEYENHVGYHEDDNNNGQSSNGSSTIQGGEAGTVAGMGRRAFETAFIKIHANLFVHGGPTREDLGFIENIQKTLGDHIGRVTTHFQVRIGQLKEQETIGGETDKALAIDEDQQKSRLDSLEQQVGYDLTEEEKAYSMGVLRFASKLNFAFFRIVLQWPGDQNVFPFVHVMLCFIWSLTGVEKLMKRVDQDIPWAHICSFLNVLAKTPHVMTPQIWAKTLPRSTSGETHLLPEDDAMRGQLCASWYYPVGWFEERVRCDIEERSVEQPSMAKVRIERILWLGMNIASYNRWISYDENSIKFQLGHGIED
ncbi:MAG: hypothetical protein Q9184_001209 [Pyrenodesmia sp. 2 TL-2023]